MSAMEAATLEGLVRLRPPEAAPRPLATWDETPIVAHEEIGSKYHRLVLYAPSIAARARAGQFVMVTVPTASGPLPLPRPMAIHRRHSGSGEIEIIFNIVGRGTELLARLGAGEHLLLTGPLGRGFEIPREATRVLLMGRGIGVCAVMGVAEDARKNGIEVTALLSSSSFDAIIGSTDCSELGAVALGVADEDGSSALGAVEETIRANLSEAPPSVIMVCGSNRLSRLAVQLGREWNAPVQVSLEAHMACGLGYCHGCAAPIPTSADKEGPLVCVDGPVFDLGLAPLDAPAMLR